MFRTLFFRVKVSGESCWPELIPGKTYFASRLRTPRVGDYVVFPGPPFTGSTSAWWVKKIKYVDGNIFHVGGTVSRASSCAVPRSLILGTVLSPR